MKVIEKRTPDRNPICEHCGAKIRMPDGRVSMRAAYKCKIDHGSQQQLMTYNGKFEYQSRQTDTVYRLCADCAYALNEVVKKWVTRS